jgi:arsenate reductase
MAKEDLASSPIRVLFLCVHNAARSQMAEALLRDIGGALFEVESAGFQPRPVLVEAIAAMRLIGIDIRDATSKSVFDLFRAGRLFDFVITVCDEAVEEGCPIFPGFSRRLKWAYPDPSQCAPGQRLRSAIETRDALRTRLLHWIDELRTSGSLPRPD